MSTTEDDASPSTKTTTPPDTSGGYLPTAAGTVAWLGSWLRWVPSSVDHLADAERRVLSYLRTPYHGRFVEIPDPCTDGETSQIWTLTMSTNSATDIATLNEPTPVVLIHGFGGGVGLWALNLDGLAAENRVHAFDLLGFGQSSRLAAFSTNPLSVEEQFADSIESWREAMQLNESTGMVLVGHSFGGFLAAAYALKYPHCVRHLVFVDPWGFAASDEPASEQTARQPLWLRAASSFFRPFNPFASVRVAGPLGPRLVGHFRPDLQRKFANLIDDDTAIANYIYHCNAQHPSGETAFKSMLVPRGQAKHPMITRLRKLDAGIPSTFIYGARSWIESKPGFDFKSQRESSQVDVKVVQGSGHHVYADRPAEFNGLINTVMRKVRAASR